MIVYKIKELIAAKEKSECRKILLIEVAEHSGVNRTALSKMLNPAFEYTTTTKVIEKLCNYFECKVEDVIEHK